MYGNGILASWGTIGCVPPTIAVHMHLFHRENVQYTFQFESQQNPDGKVNGN